MLLSGTSFGQGFSYPVIQQSTSTPDSFVPKGWTILKSATGDLNHDEFDDLALVLQHNDSVSVIIQEDNYNDTVICQPRILVIAFYNPVTKQYDKVEQSNTFILCHDNPNMEEPFQDIAIQNRVLKIEFFIFYNMGSWEMSNNSYSFRYQDNAFTLIGADDNTVNRGSGETENRSYNFLTKKVKVTTGNISSDKEEILWRKLSINELKTLKTFKQPFTYEVEKDIFL